MLQNCKSGLYYLHAYMLEGVPTYVKCDRRGSHSKILLNIFPNVFFYLFVR